MKSRVVVDASALAALAFLEPGGDAVARQLDGATVCAPTLLKFELANVAWKKARRGDSKPILTALANVLNPRWGISWQDVDAADVVLIAQATGLSTYDASYVWLAGSLGAELITLDQRLAKITSEMAV